MNPEPMDEIMLRSLSDRYARAVDRRDREALLALFAPDASLRIYETGADAPHRVLEGHERLARITDAIARYEQTFHFVGNATYDVDGTTASGEVYCVAHHLRPDGVDHVMLIRYRDTYRRDGGGWRFATRDVRADWTETRPVAP